MFVSTVQKTQKMQISVVTPTVYEAQAQLQPESTRPGGLLELQSGKEERGRMTPISLR